MSEESVRIVQRVRLNGRPRRLPTRWHKPGYTGATPSELAISPHGTDGRFALLYLDANGRALGTTMHERLGLAIGQAEWEFAVSPSEWEVVRDGAAS